MLLILSCRFPAPTPLDLCNSEALLFAAGDPSRAFAALTGNTSDAGIKQVEVVQPTTAISHDYLRHRSAISSPFLSPSTITAETALLAKASIAPKFQHNIAMTKIARVSNSLADAPRFPTTNRHTRLSGPELQSSVLIVDTTSEPKTIVFPV